MEEVTAEGKRLEENANHQIFWKKWGPYLSERQWGTVREDYSPNGDAWNYFPFDHARSRAYRWGEDGLAGISDVQQNLCFSVALWNGKDPILKERLFGLSAFEGNHGEDVKEFYYYLDNVPTHSYMKYLYKYPQKEFPSREIINENRKRSRKDPEYELNDTGIFDQNKYFDVFVEYAKAEPDDILIRIEIFNRAEEAADIVVLPTTWFRNTWSFGKVKKRPQLRLISDEGADAVLEAEHERAGICYLYCYSGGEVLFTENETNTVRLFDVPNTSPFVKDAFHDVIVGGNDTLLKDKNAGTKSAVVYRFSIQAGASAYIRLRLSEKKLAAPFDGKFSEIFSQRMEEADEFYAAVAPEAPVSDVLQVQRQAFAGLLWSKQYYNYEIETWLSGDKGQPAPPETRKQGRNNDWPYLFNRDIISMPDKWEYPWYASWDLAFHCIPLAVIDPDYAKKQLILFLREWYMHPNGQLPAYEWNFSDVNPPVHAWASLKVYELEFLASGGIRSISRYHKDNPFVLKVNGNEYRVGYEPAESTTSLFGGNSNWRGPIWIPINHLFIESLKKYYTYYGDSLKVEFPTASGNFLNLMDVAQKLSRRISGIFIRDSDGKRAVHGDSEKYRNDPNFRDLVLFNEYFQGDTCVGLGASHQTGWTALVAEMIRWCWCK